MIDVGSLIRPYPSQATRPPFLPQSNMRIKCGKDGALTNQCIVTGGNRNGDTLVYNSANFTGEKAATNVIFEGITFQSGSVSFLELYNGGGITFRNCIFRVSQSTGDKEAENPLSNFIALPFLLSIAVCRGMRTQFPFLLDTKMTGKTPAFVNQ